MNHLIMSWENVKHTIHNNISMTTVDIVFKLIQMIVDKNKKIMEKCSHSPKTICQRRINIIQ